MKDTIHQKECMSIVVPVRNRPQLILRCLDSLKSQTYRPLHVIVVDNGSSDNTLSNVKNWGDANSDDDFSIEILSDSRPGAAYARETGRKQVATDKVMFFDSDDVMRSDCVETVMDVWKEEPDLDAVTWPVAIHQDGDVRITHSAKGNMLEQHLVHAIFRTQGYAIKTAFITKAGGWLGEFPSWNDLETGARVLLASPKVRALDKVYVDVYHQKESITGESFSAKHGNWEKSLDGIDSSISRSGRKDLQRLHNIITYRRAILAAHYAKEGRKELAEPLYMQSLREIPKEKRPLIRFAYHWTRLGMRGAFSIVGSLL